MLPVLSKDEKIAQRKAKKAARRKIYGLINKEKLSIKWKEWRSQNPLTEEEKEVVRQRSRAWYKNNRERALAEKKRWNALPEVRDRRKNNQLVKAYGITLVKFNEIFASQGSKCAICKCPESKKWEVDHCHVSGVIRGILCSSCNLMLGHGGDNTETLQSAIVYLKSNGAAVAKIIQGIKG